MEITKGRLHKIIYGLLAVFLLATPAFSVYAIEEEIQLVNKLVIELKQGSGTVLAGDENIKSIEPVFVNAKIPSFKRTFEVQTTYTLSEFLNIYYHNVVYAQNDHKIKTGAVTVNDPGFAASAGDINKTWGLHKADFVNAWEKTKGASDVVVAIIDTGIDGSHEDLSAGQVGSGFNFLTRSLLSAGLNTDDNGHGTLVSGVIAATPNNFRGIVGTTWNITLMPLKALDAKGSGSSADLAAAIVYAADNGADIINMSLGGFGFSNDTTLSNAVSYAFNKGLVLVSAAGNDVAATGGNMDSSPVFPVCIDNAQNMMIGVAATDYNDQKADFSNYGKACVDVSAPGKRILTTTNRDPASPGISNSYVYASGTSLATPFVAGEAALIKALYPNADNKEIRDRIIKSTDPIDASNTSQCNGSPCFGLIGSGRINAFKALGPNLSPKLLVLSEGNLVQDQETGIIYLITGGQKQPVSSFVLNQRFPGVPPAVVTGAQLNSFPTGPYALPNEGTIFKTPSSNIVYQMVAGIKRPITYQIYLQRRITPDQIHVLGEVEVNSWVLGTFLPPIEGTLVRAAVNPTVYWVVDGLLHPINYAFWIDRGLNIFPLMIMSDNDIKSYAKGTAYVR